MVSLFEECDMRWLWSQVCSTDFGIFIIGCLVLMCVFLSIATTDFVALAKVQELSTCSATTGRELSKFGKSLGKIVRQRSSKPATNPGDPFVRPLPTSREARNTELQT